MSLIGTRTGTRRFSWPHDALPPPVLTVGSVMSLALLGDSLLYVALPAHAAELALPLWSVGVLLGANRIVRLVTNRLAARLFARIGGRAPMVAAGVGSVVTTTMYGLVPTLLPFLLARLAWGTCFSILRLGAFTVVLAASRPSTRGRLVGVYQSISRTGPVVSLLLGSLLVEALGYHATFLILGLATAPAVLLALRLPSSAYLPQPDPARVAQDAASGSGHQQQTRDSGALQATTDPQAAQSRPANPRLPSLPWRDRWFGSRRLVAVKLGVLANGFTAQGVVLATLTFALAEVAGTVEGAAALGGLLVAFRWGADLFLAPGFGHLSDRIGRGRMIPALLLMEAGAVLGLALATDRTTVIAATLAVFLTSTALTASSDAAAGDLAPPDRRAEVMSGYSDWMDIGAALGPPLAFLLADSLGLFPSYGCTAVLLLGVAVWFVVAWHREHASHLSGHR